MIIDRAITLLWAGLIFVLHLAVALRAILRPHRQPASRVAWVAVILALPLAGIVAYVLMGETNIGRRLAERRRRVQAGMPGAGAAPGWDAPAHTPRIPACHAPLFRMASAVNGFTPIGGNHAQLMHDSNTAIDALVSDIDAAKEHVHLIFYIWLADQNGLKVAAALQRAAARGVACRAMADGLGSRLLIRSPHWQALREAGVKTAVALPVGNLVLRALFGRIDLRNHRKIVIIDNRITYCGSQNCADPEFRIKAKFAPWVDVLMRFEGPVSRQNQQLFLSDWMEQTDEELYDVLRQPLPAFDPGFPAQVIGTGPTVRSSAMPEVFATLLFAARRSVFVTTPYFVPDEAMQAALCACARRGVKTRMILPARNDSWVVAAASRSYYADLLAAGVRLFEYQGGLLHAKTFTCDGQVTLVGSANMDRRSFDLNYENNILLCDPDVTASLHQRQLEFLARSHPVTPEVVAAWSSAERLRNNAIAMLSPLL